jgi:hypothetical protein
VNEPRVRFHPAAAADLKTALDWYEQQSEGLGGTLLEEVLRGLSLIAARPRAWPVSATDPGGVIAVHPQPEGHYVAESRLFPLALVLNSSADLSCGPAMVARGGIEPPTFGL